MRRVISVVLSLMAVGAAATSCAALEPQPFFYEARVLDANGNPLQGRQSFRLQADVDRRNFTSDVVSVELDKDGTARIPFLVKGALPDLLTAADAVLSVQVLRAGSDQWTQVGFPQRLGAAAATLVADDVIVLTNDQTIVVSSDLTLNKLTVSGAMAVNDLRPTSVTNPKAIEFGDDAGKLTVDAAVVSLQDRVKRIVMMSGPFPATNRVVFGSNGAVNGHFAQVSFVTGDTSPWNSSHGYINCRFTAPCDCIYEIRMSGEVGQPTAAQQALWTAAKAIQQGRVFLGLATEDDQRWLEPFDVTHGFSALECRPRDMIPTDWSRALDFSRKWLAGTGQDAVWGSRDNVLQVPMMRGETFITAFCLGPIVVNHAAKDYLGLIATSDEFVHGRPEGAAPDTKMRAAFKYYPLSAD